MYVTCGYKAYSLWGPFSLNFYGFFIALALLICVKLISLNKRYEQLKLQKNFVDIILVCIIAGIMGGRILAIISEPALYPRIYDYVALWQGGFSAFGSILGVIFIAPFYVRSLGLPIVPLCDLIAIYAPLFQAIARLGCFFAGCCHGLPTHFFINVTYVHPETIAIPNIPLHPTQLYSSCILCIIFLLLFLVIQYRAKKPGLIFCTYLMLAAAERFIIDFLRADRIGVHYWLSFHQYIALFIICCMLFLLLYMKIKKHT